jgi:hypothetical protein
MSQIMSQIFHLRKGGAKYESTYTFPPLENSNLYRQLGLHFAILFLKVYRRDR